MAWFTSSKEKSRLPTQQIKSLLEAN